ncbi:MAG TPA: ADOP family duplicated permease [Vicinamibacteria bacterium]|nr:ADOP family duplicated permease [Vicinamibacteria bacterium]
MDVLLHDVRYAARSLRSGRLFAAVSVLTLSLGLGAVTALFAVVHAVLLDPIVPDQDRVVRVEKLDTERGGFPYPLSFPEFREWRDQSRSFEALAAVDHAATGVVPIGLAGEQPWSVRLAPVSAGFFGVVHRGAPLRGRWLQEADEEPGAEVAAVVSERLWRRAWGGDPALVGRRLSWAVDRTLVVVGIAPAALDYPLGTEVWAPATGVFDGRAGRFDARSRGFGQFELLGRLAPGVSREEARAELTVVHQRLAREFPDDYKPMPVVVEPVLDGVVGPSRRVLLVLSAAALLVFVIAGVNVAALLLMRAEGRRTEMAVRIALGASHGRLLRQTLTEGLLLAALGTVGGLLLARALLGLVQGLAPEDIPRLERAALDLRVLAFGGAAALVWVMALGTAPLWSQRRLLRAPGLERSSRGARPTRGLTLFTVAEVAAAVVVAVGAGLLVRTYGRLQAVDRGLEARDLSMLALRLPEERLRDPRALLAFYGQLLPQVESLPGVLSVSPVHLGPGTGTQGLSAPMVFEGQTNEEAQTNPWSTWEPVLPSYFRTLGIPIVRGRAFTDLDRRDGAPVAVVSEAVARRYWPGQDPLGKRLRVAPDPEFPWVTVVGVAADTRYRELTKDWLTVYFAADQFFFFQASALVVRASAPLEAIVPAVRERIRALEPGATVESAATMESLLARELARPLAALAVAALFGLTAIALAAVGVYGVLSYEVQQRGRELAVRSAIGATPAHIFRAVVRRSLTVGAAGAATGLVLAASVTHTLRSLLFEVHPVDPAVFLTGAGILLGIVLLAAYVPARRAAATDPAVALRAE